MFEYYTKDLNSEFITWLSSKLNIKIGNWIGGGVEGEIYEIDKNRVIKIKYPNISTEQYLSSRNIDGIVKIYQTGEIIAPKRFKYPDGAKPSDYDYSGISLLDPNRTSGRYDTTMGYVIMERLFPDKELEKKIEFLDSNIWREFKGVYYEKNEDGFTTTRKFKNLGHHEETIKAIKKSLDGFGVELLKATFRNYNNEYFMSDLRNFITSEYNEYLDIFNRMLLIFKNIKSLNIDWGDIHSEQFAYNHKKDITAFDISFGFDDDDNIDKIKSYQKKVKNIIRESNDLDSKELAKQETLFGLAKMGLRTNRKEVFDLAIKRGFDLEMFRFKLQDYCLDIVNYVSMEWVYDTKKEYQYFIDSITILNVDDSGINSLEGIKCLKNMRKFFCDYSKIDDLEPLRELINLTELQLSNNNISDLEPISKLINLKYLRLNNNNIDTIQHVSGLSKLFLLEFSNNNVQSLEPISNLTELNYLGCDENKINNISIIGKITQPLFKFNYKNNNLPTELYYEEIDCEIIKKKINDYYNK